MQGMRASKSLDGVSTPKLLVSFLFNSLFFISDPEAYETFVSHVNQPVTQ